MLHAKTAVADGRWARVGSTDLNIASWFGNCELEAVIEDEAFASQMEEMYLRDLDNATEIILIRWLSCWSGLRWRWSPRASDCFVLDGVARPVRGGRVEARNCRAHHWLRSSRSFRNTVRWSGFSGRSEKASRNFAITVGLFRRRKVLICPSTSSVVI